jgi:hypothetical protein
MKMGIGIGWPNSTSGKGGPYSFTIQNCLGQSYLIWSDSSAFLPGAYIFKNEQLTDPFTFSGYWNYPELIDSIGGYEMLLNGEVDGTLMTCPA